MCCGYTQDMSFSAHQIRACEGPSPVWEVPCGGGRLFVATLVTGTLGEKSDPPVEMMNGQGRVSPGSAAPAEERGCTWLNIWVFLIFALAIKAAFVTLCLLFMLHPGFSSSSLLPFCHSSEQPSALQQHFSQWECDSAGPQGTDRGWTCCPKGWRRFQGSCYFLSTDKMNCAESAENCTGMGSHLVVITSRAEQEFLFKQQNQDVKRENLYIGLFEKGDQWQWVDKTPYSVTAAFWRKGEPSNNYGENCTVMHLPEGALKNWNDVIPTTKQHRICEAAAVIV
ncbi:C-type lectin domain family 6 member A-like [Haemorhous mexicanus]|uniref:C-type lectin domain family 6 member A-like n=1 Tax=Haemorhous mexicanus TaxID=30427 RepID=UPI0028BD6DD4|nr:C-type lectin domain family 6 member A-like [Haemorhous mexicanus]